MPSSCLKHSSLASTAGPGDAPCCGQTLGVFCDRRTSCQKEMLLSVGYLPKVVIDKLRWTKDLNYSADNKGLTTRFPLSPLQFMLQCQHCQTQKRTKTIQSLSKSVLSDQHNWWTSHRRHRTLEKKKSRTIMLCYAQRELASLFSAAQQFQSKERLIKLF